MNRQQRRSGAKTRRAAGDPRDAAVVGRLESGLAHQRAGRWGEAEACYQHALAAQPENADALHLLGVVAFETGRYEVAAAMIGQAIKRNRNNPIYSFNHGLALKHLGRLDEALASYDRAIGLEPDYVEAHNDRGIVLEALRRPADALASFERALALRPDYIDALYNRANALKDLGQLEAAVTSYDRVLALKADHPQALNNRGNALLALRRLEEARASYDRAIALKRDYVEAFNNRGVVLQELGAFDAAVKDCDTALALMPDCAQALYNRGNALAAQDRFTEALVSYDRAITLAPDHAQAHYNRANALKAVGQIDAALAAYGKAQALKPDYVEARWNEAYLRLLTGDFARGLAQAECRWQNPALGLVPRAFPQPLWTGAQALDGKTILLHADEGFGDAIFYSRYVPLLAARGARVIIEAETPLHPLMAGLAGVSRCVAPADPVAFDLHCPLSSLPLAFATRVTKIPPIPALQLPPSPKWREQLGSKQALRVGLAWSGNPRHANDRNRSIPLTLLAPLVDAGVSFVSLQKDLRPADATALGRMPRIRDLSLSLENFADTAGLIGELDLVIAADTSVAHLAGALGAPVWILLPFVPDWRWLLNRPDSPWYPSARLFRQDERRDWRPVVASVERALRALISARRGV